MDIISPINLIEASGIDSCSICLNNMNNDNEIYTIENCNHKYHTKCILEMFIEGFTDTCPLCRSIISTTESRCRDFEDYKFKLVLKYSEKPNANILIKNMVKKYKNSQNKIKELERRRRLIPKDHGNDVLKKMKQTRTKINIFKRARAHKLRLYRPRNTETPKDIRQIIKNCKLQIKNIIKDSIDTLKKENKVLKNSESYEQLKQLANIKRCIFKQQNISKKIKKSLANIPFTPNV